MFRIPSFGDEVIALLWDKSLLTPAIHPQASPQIILSKDYAGSTCSLFGMQSLSFRSNSETDSGNIVSEHPSPATIGKDWLGSWRIEDLKAVEGGAMDSSFHITQQWLSSILHICKIRASFSERIDTMEDSLIDIYESSDLLGKMLDWRPVENAVMKYNRENNLPLNDTDFFLCIYLRFNSL